MKKILCNIFLDIIFLARDARMMAVMLHKKRDYFLIYKRIMVGNAHSYIARSTYHEKIKGFTISCWVR